MNGHEFMDALQALPAFDKAHTRMAYLTYTMTDADVAASKAKGMNYFYFKTVNDFKLDDIVKEIFG